MSSSSSGSLSESSSSPAPTRKRKEDVESSNSSDEDSDAPQPPPPVETTVLSHAERRRQKKRQRQDQLATTSESQSQSPRKKRKLNDSSSPSEVCTEGKTKTKNTSASKALPKITPVADNPRHQKRRNSVWVGNLSYQTTQEALRAFFDGVGTITRIHMPIRRGKQPQGENMGFAYIDFETPEAKVIAIALSEGQLEGRNLLIKDGDDFTGRPAKVQTEPVEEGGENSVKSVTKADTKSLSKTSQKILRTQKQPPAQTLFLGNLGFETTEESIRELFVAHRYWKHRDKGKEADIRAGNQKVGAGEDAGAEKPKDVWIRKIRMGTFEDSGACKGFAFVDFTSIEHATEALVNPRNHRLNGRDLVVEYASPDAVRRGGGPRNLKGDRDRKSKVEGVIGKTPQKRTPNAPYNRQRLPRHVEREANAVDEEIPMVVARPFDSRERDRAGHDRPHTRRAKPGAALARAQRQSVAIVPSQNQKIVF